MKSQHLYRSLLAVSVLAAAPLVGSAQITRFEIAGIPQVVRATTGGFSGGVRTGHLIGYNTTTDRIHWHDSAGSSAGHSLFWLDPTVSGDLGTSPNALTGSVRHYSSTDGGNTYYAGTVTGNVKTSYGAGANGFAYVPDTNSMFNVAGGGNSATIVEYQPARSVSGSDLVGEGTTGDMTNSAREISRTPSTLTTGEFHNGLAYLGDDGSNYEFLMINRIGTTTQEGVKLDVSKTVTGGTTTTSGSRTLAVGPEGGSAFVTSAELNGLVPGVDDFIKDLANDLSGNIYAVSADGTNNYLSAFSVDDLGIFTQIDLDPDTAALHVDLMDLITDNAGTEIAAVGLTVNGDASKIYISANNSSGTTLDSIFIFDQVVASAAVPEPASIAIWSLLGLALAGFCCLRSRRKI